MRSGWRRPTKVTQAAGLQPRQVHIMHGALYMTQHAARQPCMLQQAEARGQGMG